MCKLFCIKTLGLGNVSQSRRRWPHVVFEIGNSITSPPTARYFRQCAHRTRQINCNYIMLGTEENGFDLAMVSREKSYVYDHKPIYSDIRAVY